MTMSQEVLAYESEENCSYLDTAPYELYQHDHSKTMDMDGSVAWWDCNMTLDDAPIRRTLERSEARLTESSPTYKPAVRGAALTHAWLCGSALADEYVDFGKAFRQVPSREYTLVKPFVDNLTTEHLPFQAFSAQLAQVALGSTETKTDVGFSAAQVMCYGSLDLSLYPDCVDAPSHCEGGVYTFTPMQRMLIFNLAPDLEVWWRPEIGRIKVERHTSDATAIEDILGSIKNSDPYALTRNLLGTFVLNSRPGLHMPRA